MKNLSKREIVNLYGDDGIQYRSQNMWNGSLTSEIPEEIKMENNNSKEIIELGRKHGKEDLAMNAVVAGQSYEDFRNELLDNVSNDKPLDLARGEGMDAKSFDLNKAFREFVDGKQISGLEGEWQQELKRSKSSTRHRQLSAPPGAPNLQVTAAPSEEASASDEASADDQPEDEAAPITTDEKTPAQIIESFEASQLKDDIPSFRPGDTVVVSVKVREGERTRLQAFEGVVMNIKNAGLNSSFIVRKISSGIGVERTFQLHSPMIDSITVKRKGDVRQAKLYYLRERSGRSARIKERLD